MPEEVLAHQVVESLTGLGLDNVQQCLCWRYLKLLQRWNKAYNLTAVTALDDMAYIHLLDSLSVIPVLPNFEAMGDLGSGAGLPGIPLAIAMPDRQFLLIDSNGKKSAFQRQAITELKLGNISVRNARVENLGNSAPLDCVISRAFASLSQMVAWAKCILRPHGNILAMKGVYPGEELIELGPEIELVAVHRLHVPGKTLERHLVHLRCQ